MTGNCSKIIIDFSAASTHASTDSGKNVVWSATYNPFGDTRNVTGTLTTQSLRLPGQQFDPETGYSHNGFRDYAGSLTRYVESDPIGLRGGPNTYQYVFGNPFKYTDRRGLDPGATIGTAAGKLWDQYTSGGNSGINCSLSDPICAIGYEAGKLWQQYGAGGSVSSVNCDPQKTVCSGGSLPDITPPQEPGMPDSGWPQSGAQSFNPFPTDGDNSSVPLLPFDQYPGIPSNPRIDPTMQIFPPNPSPTRKPEKSL